MNRFDSREEGFEKRFAVDEEINFKARARRNKRIGLWAARLFGKDGASAEAYAVELVASQAAAGGEEAIFASLRADFDRAGVEMSDHRIRRKLAEALEQARAEIVSGK